MLERRRSVGPHEPLWLADFDRADILTGRLHTLTRTGARAVHCRWPVLAHNLHRRAETYGPLLDALAAEGLTAAEIFTRLRHEDARLAHDALMLSNLEPAPWLVLDLEPTEVLSAKRMYRAAHATLEAVGRSRVALSLPADPVGFQVASALVGEGVVLAFQDLTGASQTARALQALARGLQAYRRLRRPPSDLSYFLTFRGPVDFDQVRARLADFPMAREMLDDERAPRLYAVSAPSHASLDFAPLAAQYLLPGCSSELPDTMEAHQEVVRTIERRRRSVLAPLLGAVDLTSLEEHPVLETDSFRPRPALEAILETLANFENWIDHLVDADVRDLVWLGSGAELAAALIWGELYTAGAHNDVHYLDLSELQGDFDLSRHAVFILAGCTVDEAVREALARPDLPVERCLVLTASGSALETYAETLGVLDILSFDAPDDPVPTWTAELCFALASGLARGLSSREIARTVRSFVAASAPNLPADIRPAHRLAAALRHVKTNQHGLQVRADPVLDAFGAWLTSVLASALPMPGPDAHVVDVCWKRAPSDGPEDSLACVTIEDWRSLVIEVLRWSLARAQLPLE